MSATTATAHAHTAHVHHELGFVRTYIFSTDHKMIARQFLFMGLLMMIVGGLLALMVRWQLAWPETPVPGLGGILTETGGILRLKPRDGSRGGRKHTKAQQAKLQEENGRKQAQLKKARDELTEAFPDWDNGKYQELMKFGVEVGYTPQEVAEIIDPRVFKLLDVAKKYDALQKAKPEVEKKLVKVPKVVKPGTTDKNEKADRAEEKWKRLNKEKSVEAAASIIYDMI